MVDCQAKILELLFTHSVIQYVVLKTVYSASAICACIRRKRITGRKGTVLLFFSVKARLFTFYSLANHFLLLAIVFLVDFFVFFSFTEFCKPRVVAVQ